MIVFNAGVPRSGTVYVNSIVRRLLEGAVVQANLHGAALAPGVLNLIGQCERSNLHAIVHTHEWNEATSALVRENGGITGFLNYRDPRDACVSLMTLHDLSLADAADEIFLGFGMFEIAGAETGWRLIRYETLTQDPEMITRSVARELGLDPTDARIAAILAETSLERHRMHMRKVAAGDLPRLRHIRNRARVLVEDPDTLISDRHIQSGATGRWREELSAEETRYLNQRFNRLLVDYGYPLA